MSFAEVPGQEQAVTFFRHAVAGGRLAHAYILVGSAGSGRRALARALGQYLFCANRGDPADTAEAALAESADACGTCRACRLIAQDAFADFHWYARPEGKQQLVVQVIEEFRREVHLKPLEADRKVFVIEDADKLNPSSANKLLKVLEEPPPESLLLLLALDVRDFLPTILSRCHVVRLQPMPTEALSSRLERFSGCSAEAAGYLSHFTMGSPGQASMLAEANFFAERDWLVDLATTLREGEHFIPAEELFKQASAGTDSTQERRERLLRYLDVLALFYRDVLAAAFSSETPLVNTGRAADVRALATRLGSVRAERILSAVARAREAVSLNANQKLLLENLTFDLAQLQSL